MTEILKQPERPKRPERLTIKRDGSLFNVRVDGKVVATLDDESLTALSDGCTDLYNRTRQDLRLDLKDVGNRPSN